MFHEVQIRLLIVTRGSYIHCSFHYRGKVFIEVFICLRGKFAFLSKVESDSPIFSICQVAHGDLLSPLFNVNGAGTVKCITPGIVTEATHERAKVYHFIVVP